MKHWGPGVNENGRFKYFLRSITLGARSTESR